MNGKKKKADSLTEAGKRQKSGGLTGEEKDHNKSAKGV